MLDAYALDALDRTIRDIEYDYTKKNKLMGGKLLVMSGDFRQCLLVLPNQSMATVLSRLITRSNVWMWQSSWKPCHILQLWRNERVMNCPGVPEEELQEWADYLLRIGNGREPLVESDLTDLPIVRVKPEMLVSSVEELIAFVFDENKSWKDCAIVCPRVSTVTALNNMMLKRIDGDEHVFYSTDDMIEGNSAFPFFFTVI